MADTDDDLQEEVNNAVTGNQPGDAAENDQGDTGEGDSQEDVDTSDADGEGDSAGGSAGSASNPEAEDDEEDDDEDDDLAPFQQPGIHATTAPENFDIRTLPRDANGLIDPEQANKAIQQWAEQRASAQLAGVQTEAQARTVLTTQWTKAKEKYPFLSQNKDLAGLTRDLHLNSIVAAQNGTGRYLSPLMAAKKVNKMYARAVKSGVTQQRTKQSVVRTGTSERSGGKSSGGQKSEYQEASEMALSKDPKIAREGRQKVMSLRYLARHQ